MLPKPSIEFNVSIHYSFQKSIHLVRALGELELVGQFPLDGLECSFSDHVEWRNSGEDSRLQQSNCQAPIEGTKKNLHAPHDMDDLQP
jgi:hypothetical protein